MTKSKLNLVIDALLLLCIAAMAGIGLLMKYVLVPGYQRWEIYNRNVELFFWGLGRHDWGAIHFVTGLVFLVLLILHIALHWPMIVGIYRTLIPSRWLRWIIAVLLVSLTILFFIFPYFVKPELQEHGPGRGRGRRQCESQCDDQYVQLKDIKALGFVISLANMVVFVHFSEVC